MERTLGFPTIDVLKIMALVVAFYIALLFPALYSGVVALRRKPRIARPWLFVLTVTSLSYGLLVMAYMAFVPIWAYSIYIAPQLQSSGFPSGASFLLPLSESLEMWGPLLIPVLAAISSIPITRFLMQSWRPRGVAEQA